MSRGPELLGSHRMTELMAKLRSQYNVILVDTPPLAAGVDAYLMSAATGGLVVVLRSGETDRQFVEAKLQLVDRLPTTVLGAILNHIDVGHGSYKYYAYEYGPTTEEPVDENPVPAPISAQG